MGDGRRGYGLVVAGMIKSRDLAEQYTADQRRVICEHCRLMGKANCKSCALPATMPHQVKEKKLR